jgi:hypothetical protein
MIQRLMDAGGATLSGICLIHCLALPSLGALLPFAGILAHDERVHWAIIVLAVPTALLAFSARIRTQRNGWGLAGIAAVGVSLMAAAMFAPESAETFLSVAGGVTLASAHLANMATSRKHTH